MHTEVDSKLHTLLNANRDFALSKEGFTNHCPMALCALADMGASAARLQDFFDYWAQRYALHAAPVTDVIESADWRQAYGRKDAFNPLQRCFANWIASDGYAEVIPAVFPCLVAAPASVAFHALIRLGHALAVNNDDEIAAGLAAFVSNPRVLAPGRGPNPNAAKASAAPVSPNSVAEELRLLQHACARIQSSGDWIDDRLAHVAQHSDFIEAFRPITASPERIDEIAEAAIQLFWRTEHFTALHMVTALHAARRVCTRLPIAEAATLTAELWRAFCAAYVGVLATSDNADWPLQPASAQQSTACDWQPLLQAAVASNDDHVIKLVATCWHEWQRVRVPQTPQAPATSARLYYLAAARACGINTATM